MNEYIANFILAYVGGSIELIGLIGNILLWVALTQQGNRKAMYTILRTMCLTDIVILLLSFMFQALPAAGNLNLKMINWVLIVYQTSYYVWPIATAIHFIKVWLTVLLSVERWTAVCRPLEFRITGSATRVRLQILTISAASVAFVLPRYFEYECNYPERLNATDPHSMAHSNNVTSTSTSTSPPTLKNSSSLALVSVDTVLCQWVQTSIAESFAFSVCYGVIAYALLAFVFPVGIVLLLNSLIIIELNRSDNLIAELTLMQKYERKISKVPLCVAVVFCILQTPALLINVIHFSGLAKDYPYWQVTLAVGGTLISTNSAIDFIVCFYNIGCTVRMKRVKRSTFRTKIPYTERSSRLINTSSDVQLNETTRKRWFIVASVSAHRLTMHHSETITSKYFKEYPSNIASL